MNYNSIASPEDDSTDDLSEIPFTVIEALRLEESALPCHDDHTSEYNDYSLLTFRYFLLSFLFVIPGAFIETMNSYRTTSAPYGILFVQFLTYPLGKYLSKILPNKQFNCLGLFNFNLNPRPWSIKESVLVTLTAASGATGNMGTAGISIAKVVFDIDIDPLVAITFMYGIVWTGYSFGAIARNFVLYDPKFIWPKALMQTSLFKLQESSDYDIGGNKYSTEEEEGPMPPNPDNNNQMKIFLIGLTFMFLWQFLPEFIFPFLSSLAVICWMAPYSANLNFVGSGLGGMGFLNFSLDWSNITSSVMLNPYWTIVLQFLGFVMTCWVFLPFCKWFQNGKYSFGLMDNHALLSSGEKYPISELITSDLKFNETAYQFYGPIHYGSQRLFNIFFDYAAYVSAIATLITFGLSDFEDSLFKIRKIIDKSKAEEEEEEEEQLPLLVTDQSSNKPKHAMSSHYSDRINKLYSSYEDVPTSWFVALFLVSFTFLSIIIVKGLIFISWRTYIVALGIGAIIVIPMSSLYAVSNFQLAIGTFNELLYGFMIQSSFFLPANGIKHPVGAGIYGAIAGNCWYRAQYILQDQKIGMYNQIPPKLVFFSQIFGDLIGVPFNYLSLRWVLDQKLDYLRGDVTDPLHQWTGQSLVSSAVNSAQYVLVGPKILFHEYPILPYGFLVGVMVPLIFYWIFKITKFEKLKYFNLTILFSTMSTFYGNISTGYLTQILLGTYTMYYLYNFRRALFKKYNYVLAAAFDTGFNFCNLFIFIVFGSGWFTKSGRPFNFPHWWGNDPNNLEKCYAL